MLSADLQSSSGTAADGNVDSRRTNSIWPCWLQRHWPLPSRTIFGCEFVGTSSCKSSLPRYGRLPQELLDNDKPEPANDPDTRHKSSSHAFQVGMCAALIALVVVLAHSRRLPPPWVMHKCDPFGEPGYVYYDEARPAQTQWRPLLRTCDPAPDWLGMLSRTQEMTEGLEFLRGKTALVIGDSTDRQMIEDLANITQSRRPKIVSYYEANVLASDDAQMKDVRSHGAPRLLYYEQLDFRIISVFHYGLLSDLRASPSTAPDVHKPIALQDRLTELFRPLVEIYTDELDFVRFQSGLWDVDALTVLSDDLAHAHQQSSGTQSVYLEEDLPLFARYTLRYAQALRQIQETFPHAVVWARTMHRPGQGPHKEHFGDLPVKRLSQGAKEGAREAHVRMFDFGNLFEGWQDHADWIHPNRYPGTALMAQALIHEMYLEFDHV